MIFVISVVLVSYGIEEADALRTLKVKAVLNFELPNTEAQVENYYDNVIKPQAVTIINTYSVNIANFTMQARSTSDSIYIIGFNETSGKNIFELYPKVVFFGDLPNGVTKQQFNNAFDNFIDEIKDMMKTELISNGATSIKGHFHYSIGSVDENG